MDNTRQTRTGREHFFRRSCFRLLASRVSPAREQSGAEGRSFVQLMAEGGNEARRPRIDLLTDRAPCDIHVPGKNYIHTWYQVYTILPPQLMKKASEKSEEKGLSFWGEGVFRRAKLRQKWHPYHGLQR